MLSRQLRRRSIGSMRRLVVLLWLLLQLVVMVMVRRVIWYSGRPCSSAILIGN